MDETDLDKAIKLSLPKNNKDDFSPEDISILQDELDRISAETQQDKIDNEIDNKLEEDEKKEEDIKDKEKELKDKELELEELNRELEKTKDEEQNKYEDEEQENKKEGEQEKNNNNENNDNNDSLTITIDTTTLKTLCQNINANLIVNIVAYKNVLQKLNTDKSNSLNEQIALLDSMENQLASLLKEVQINLKIPEDKRINTEKLVQEVSGNNNAIQKLLGAEAAAILGTMGAATVLMLGGKKQKKNRQSSIRNKTLKLFNY